MHCARVRKDLESCKEHLAALVQKLSLSGFIRWKRKELLKNISLQKFLYMLNIVSPKKELLYERFLTKFRSGEKVTSNQLFTGCAITTNRFQVVPGGQHV